MAEQVEVQQNVEAERGVLSCILTEPSTLRQVQAVISRAEAFTDPELRLIYETILSVDIVDPLTLLEKVVGAGGNAVTVSELAGVNSTTTHVEHYATIVQEAYMLRQAASAARQIAFSAKQRDASPHKVLTEAIESLRKVSMSAGVGAESLADIRQPYQQHMQAVRDGKIPMMLTGIRVIDDMVRGGGGLWGKMVVVGAQSSDGKTSLGISIATNLAAQGVPVVIQSAESSKYEFLSRFDKHVIPEGEFSVAGWDSDEGIREEATRKLIQKYRHITDGLPITVDDCSEDLDRRIAATYAYVERTGAKVVIWDFLQEFHIETKGNVSLEERVREMVRKLNRARRDMGVCFIVLSQFRKGEGYSDSRPPTKADLYGSGAIEQAADLILIQWVPEDGKHAAVTPVRIQVAKQRDGMTGWVTAEFIKPQLLIRDEGSPRRMKKQETAMLEGMADDGEPF